VAEARSTYQIPESSSTNRSPALHTSSLRVRTYECDAYGHVNNAVYLNYLEHARGLFLEHQGLDYQALVSAGFGIWVAEAKLVFRSPALPGEELTILSEPSEAGAAWAVLKQGIFGPAERPVLEASMKLVWVGSGGRPTRIPPEWREKLAGHL
jgi:YbgC/YbaW family acyl-CoA thioester hydrolase